MENDQIFTYHRNGKWVKESAVVIVFVFFLYFSFSFCPLSYPHKGGEGDCPHRPLKSINVTIYVLLNTKNVYHNSRHNINIWAQLHSIIILYFVTAEQNQDQYHHGGLDVPRNQVHFSVCLLSASKVISWVIAMTVCLSTVLRSCGLRNSFAILVTLTNSDCHLQWHWHWPRPRHIDSEHVYDNFQRSLIKAIK